MDEEAESLGVLSWTVTVGGARLDAFLMKRLAGRGHSRTEVQGWIQDGRVRVLSPRARPGQESPRALKRSLKLKAGSSVVLNLPPPPPPPGPLLPEDLPVPILHQDASILVLDKPAGLTVHPGAGQSSGTLANALLHISPGRLSTVGGKERPGIVHRLDKDTSGVLVVARSDAAHRELARQFHDREVRKTYLALVEGVPRAPEGVLQWPLGRHPRDRKKMAVVEGGRAAETHYRVAEVLGRRALLELRPKTGRTHQIRVHLQRLGTPILADATYGRGARCEGPGGVLLARQALHAFRLSFRHPASGQRVRHEAPLAPDMARMLAALRERGEG